MDALMNPPRRRPVMQSGLLAMLIFIAAEVMFFAGTMSAFTIVRAGALPGMWPPPNQPRLPAEASVFNTLVLLASGAALFAAHLRYKKGKNAFGLGVAALGLGAGFVVLQGREWLKLLAQGLTMTSSPLGGFFYLIVGTHALHAMVALAVLGVVVARLRRGIIRPGFFFGAQALWYFVVLMWPVIYGRVYF
jgi:heme/copper-type cytochrome/quinol oxidase subunit 3